MADYAIEQAQHAIDLLPEFEKVTDWQGNSPRFKSTPCKGAANALLAHLCAWKAGGKYFAKHQDYDEKELWERAEKGERIGKDTPGWELVLDLIGVLLLQEMMCRRKTNRRRYTPVKVIDTLSKR